MRPLAALFEEFNLTRNRIKATSRKVGKTVYQLTRTTKSNGKSLLIILGCQRSGTTLMTRILEKDWNAKVFWENSRLSIQGEGEDRLRLKPLSFVNQAVQKEPFPLVVMKPLVESQNAGRLLEYFPDCRAVWMYRNYKDVAVSNLSRFGVGNGIRNLRYIAENQKQNWRVENVPDRVREIVAQHFSERMDPFEAAALFWYVRNSFFFELGLNCHPRVMTCKYDELAIQPNQTMMKIYRFMSQPYPGDHILKGIHTASIGAGKHIHLSKGIEDLCEQLWNRIEAENSQAALPVT